MKHDHTHFTGAEDVPYPVGFPAILIRRPDESYVGAARYKRELTWNNTQLHDGELKLLFRSPSGDGYLQARVMAELDAIKGKMSLRHALNAAGLPLMYAGSAMHVVPSVMSQVEDDLFVHGAADHLGPEKILIERSSRNSPAGTGSFTTLQAHLRYRSCKGLSEEQIQHLGAKATVALLSPQNCLLGTKKVANLPDCGPTAVDQT